MWRSLVLLFALTACSRAPFNDSYISQYSHLELRRALIAQEKPLPKTDYSLTVFVDAKHLDYTNCETLIESIRFHPDGAEDRTFGHGWIRLVGLIDGRPVSIVGGHSGEIGADVPKYLDQVLLAQGVEPNPIRYLFTARDDGYFEEGSGGHSPTFAIFLPISQEQFQLIWKFIQQNQYAFSRYSLTENQCTSFIAKISSMAGLDLDHEITMNVPSSVTLFGRSLALWQDSRYSTITLSTPDVLERSMLLAVAENRAYTAYRVYREKR